jgi:hypothetical protein
MVGMARLTRQASHSPVKKIFSARRWTGLTIDGEQSPPLYHWPVWDAYLLLDQILVAQLGVIIKQVQYGVN